MRVFRWAYKDDTHEVLLSEKTDGWSITVVVMVTDDSEPSTNPMGRATCSDVGFAT